MTAATDTLHTNCWAALSTVRDPELDEPVTDLGFVTELTVADGDEGGAAAFVRLRLPTFFCAPNFAYLMVADAHDALAAVPGVERVEVRLDDHFAADEVNAGVAAGKGFSASFPGLAAGELDELRRTFLRKAHLAAQERICRRLLADGRTLADLPLLRLGDMAACADLDRLRRRRRELALPAGPDAPLLVDERGRPLAAEELPDHLTRARTTRVSIEGNAAFCRGLLRTRYGVEATPSR